MSVMEGNQMSNIDEQFIEYIVKSLVSNPDAVKLERTIDEKGVLLELTVDPEDLGRVIGKRGATAQSLRTLLRALGTKNDARYNLKIVDNGAPRPERPERAPREERNEERQENPKSEEEPKREKAEKPAEPAEEPEVAPEDDASSNLSKTRKELAELDDLDL
ncbi:MAG: KH domain-containing protein [Candidatus Saccharibacteria bacterium]